MHHGARTPHRSDAHGYPFRVKKPTVEERRTEILETTCQVVIDRGFAGTRISDVAKRLDVSSSLIHYHFDSKEQLLAEAFAHYARKDLATLQAEIDSAPTAAAKLERLIQDSVPEGSDDLEWMLWIDAWGEALRNPMMRKISQELDEQSVDVLIRVLDHGVQQGEFTCTDTEATATRISALVDGLAIQFAAHTGVLTRDALIHHVRVAAASEVGLTPAMLGHVGDANSDVRAPSPAVEIALRQLISRYCDGVNRVDASTWGATWAPDATWLLGADPVVGRPAIVAAWEAAMAGFEWVVHTAPTMVFEIDELTGLGTGRVTVSERIKRTDAKPNSILATYHDEYVRTGGEWLFQSRRLQVHDVA
jgi:AcrR family transcriptional regulator